MDQTRHSSRKPRALIVDDEPDMLEFIERVLRKRFQVTRASSAEEALPLLRAGDFQLVVTDNQMLQLSGLDMLDALGSSCPELVRVVMSGFTDDPDIEAAIARGALDSYALKPLASQNLLASIEDAYRVRAARRS